MNLAALVGTPLVAFLAFPLETFTFPVRGFKRSVWGRGCGGSPTCCNPGDVESRRDPKKMGISVALPAAMPHGGRRKRLARTRATQRGLSDGDLISRVARARRATPSSCCTGATPDRFSALRSGASATGCAPRTPYRRRSPRSGVLRARTGRSAAPGHPGSTRSPATRSSTASRNRSEPPAEAPDTPSLEPTPAERAETSYVSVAGAPRARRAL